MSEHDEIKIGTQGTAGQAVERGPMTWRQTLVGVGMFCLVIALFASAGLKESGGLVGKIIGGVGLMLMAVGIVGNLMHAISSRKNRGVATDSPVGTTSRS